MELRRLREAKGLKIEQVASTLECAPSTVSRMETGQVSLKPRDLRAMLTLYEVSGARQEELLELARQARRRGWWHGHSDIVGTFAKLEAAAASIRSYEALVVPGLLQTEEYARVVLRMGLPDMPDHVIERKVKFRMARQSHLLREADPPAIWVVLDEAVLRRPIGGHAIMREQFRRLVLAVQQPNVRLQVLPFSVGEHPGIGGSFAIVSFTEPDDQIVYLEQSERIVYPENAADISRYKLAFERLQAAAADPAESSGLLTKLAT
jgi:transcriptional regulator with XRE-family HTH domain